VEDILPLVYHVMRKETPQGRNPPSLDQESAAILEAYAWPGNVREVENAVKHAMTFAQGDKLTKEVLPQKILLASHPVSSQQPVPSIVDASKCKSLKAFLRDKEKDYLQQILKFTGGDKERAAKALKISLATLYRKLPENGE
jgi:DNA-binding NtrC family response regulator